VIHHAIAVSVFEDGEAIPAFRSLGGRIGTAVVLRAEILVASKAAEKKAILA